MPYTSFLVENLPVVRRQLGLGDWVQLAPDRVEKAADDMMVLDTAQSELKCPDIGLLHRASFFLSYCILNSGLWMGCAEN